MDAMTNNAVAQSNFEANILDGLTLNQALRLAEKKAKERDIEEANRIYKDILLKFPQNKRAQQSLTVLNRSKHSATIQIPHEDTVKKLLSLYNQGQLPVVVEQAKALTQQYPEAFMIWNILGAALKGLGRVQVAYEAFKKVTDLSPKYADGFNNLGLTLQDQGKLDEAIASYNKAISLKPDHAEAYNNKANVLKYQGKLDEAIASYNKVLSLKPDHPEAKKNLIQTLKTFSPKNIYVNQLIDVDNKIKAKHSKNTLPTADQELAIFTLDLLSRLQGVDRNLSTERLQIYRRNKVDINCKRHMKIFKEKEIIPQFCFDCYKVQVEVKTVLDLIRLCALFY